MSTLDQVDGLRMIRVDHTGGLRQPASLRQLVREYRADRVSEAELREGQQRAVQDVIAKQEQLGLPVVSDGEFFRIGGFQESFGGAVTGFDAIPYKEWDSAQPEPVAAGSAGAPPRREESGVSGPGPAILHRLPVKERLRLVRNLILEEYRFGASVSETPVKVTLIGPDRILQRFEYESSTGVYADPEEFLADVVAIERRMIEEVVAAGCRYVQIDEPGYTAYVDPILTAKMRERGEDPHANLARSIEADNELIAGFPGVTFAVHVCRGGGGGRGGPAPHREGTYDAIAEQLFSEARFDRFLLEYDGEHAGSFSALRFMPRDRVAVLGIASNHGPVEPIDYLKQRLDEASRYIDLEQVAVCPRCGMRRIATEEMQWDKLRALQAVAADVWSG